MKYELSDHGFSQLVSTETELCPENKNGRSVEVVHAKDGVVQLNEEVLEKLLILDEAVVDKPVVVISIAGDFRKGKSFLLNFILQYFKTTTGIDSTHDRTQQGTDFKDWLGHPNGRLEGGFPWRGGSAPETSGIMIWNQLFPVTLPNGEEIVVLLADTEGSFGMNQTWDEEVSTFCLSTLASSTQIYNLSQGIQEDMLRNLHFFAEYSQMASKTECSPLQRFTFLVRDWQWPDEFPFGSEGGGHYLEERVFGNVNLPSEGKKLRSQLQECFDCIDCFLLPYPGEAIARATKPPDGLTLKDIDPEFRKGVGDFVSQVASPAVLKPKLLNGEPVTCRTLYDLFKTWTTRFNEEMPKPQLALSVTWQVSNRKNIRKITQEYNVKMESMCSSDIPYFYRRTFDGVHKTVLNELQVENVEFYGDEEAKAKGKKELLEELDRLFQDVFKPSNQAKKTPFKRTLEVVGGTSCAVLLGGIGFVAWPIAAAGGVVAAATVAAPLVASAVGLSVGTASIASRVAMDHIERQ